MPETKKQLQEKITKLRNALIGVIGVSETKELEAMEFLVRAGIAGRAEEDTSVVLNAIHAIRDTAKTDNVTA